MIKKCMWVQCKVLPNSDITIIKVASHMKYRHNTSLSNYVGKVKNKFGIDPIMKWEIVKRWNRYKGKDRYCKLCMEEKLTIATYNIPKELLNQRSELFNICRHRKNWLISE